MTQTITKASGTYTLYDTINITTAMLTMNLYASLGPFDISVANPTYKLGSTPLSFNIGLNVPCPGEYVYYDITQGTAASLPSFITFSRLVNQTIQA